MRGCSAQRGGQAEFVFVRDDPGGRLGHDPPGPAVWMRSAASRSELHELSIHESTILTAHCLSLRPSHIYSLIDSVTTINLHTSKVLDLLRARKGVVSSQDIQSALGVSQATVSRLLSALIKEGRLLKVGAARAQKYLLPRHVRGIDTPIVPVMRIDEVGEAAPFAKIIPIHDGRYWLEESQGPAKAFDGLPWFMMDMRPQGFIGRTYSNAHPELALPDNPEHWKDDDVLKALATAGEDLPGNLIVGAQSFDLFNARQFQPPHDVTEDDYPALADSAMKGTVGGSSAGGEQPKFCARRSGRHVLVKFSPAGNSEVAQRMRDLLVCEHLALTTLNSAGSPAAISSLYFAGGRAFLELNRFDRTTHGRIGMVSLMAYDAEFVGHMDNWASTAARLHARELITQEDAARLQFLEAFGRLIGNTDRHYGNISLMRQQGQWRLSRTYDMLPMIYAPVAGELVARDFEPGTLKPTADTLESWDGAREVAAEFWAVAADDLRLSDGFRQLIAGHAAQLEEDHQRRAADRPA